MNSRLFFLLLPAVGFLPIESLSQTSQYQITTNAGASDVRDGRPARAAILQYARGLGFDTAGRLYVTDSSAHRIRRVTPDNNFTGSQAYGMGQIETIAGTGAPGFSGDGQSATAAYLSSPQDLVLDSAGNLYFTDAGNNRVRVIDPNGSIRTFAGGGTIEAENVPADTIRLQGLGGLAIDSANNLYVSEARGFIRRISPQGVITTFAGGGDLDLEADGGPARKARLLQPAGLAVDGQGHVYVAEQPRHCIRRITPEGIISTVAGTGALGSAGDGGPATKAQLSYPSRLAVDETGAIFVVDSFYRIRTITPDGTMQLRYNGYSTIDGLAFGPGPALWLANGSRMGTVESTAQAAWAIGTQPELSEGLSPLESLLYLSGMALDSEGVFYLSESRYGRLRAISRNGTLTMLTGASASSSIGDGGPLANARLMSPGAVLTGRSGDLWIADPGNSRIRHVSRGDGIIRTVAGDGQRGNSGDGGPATTAQISSVSYIALDPDGNLYLSSFGSLRKVDTRGIISTIAGTGQSGFSGDGGPALEARIYGSAGIAAAHDGGVYFADYGNRRIRYVSPQGMISTVAGGGTNPADGPATDADLPAPRDIAIGPSGDIFIATLAAIYRLSPTGWLERIAGGLVPGFSGDGGPALEALLYSPGSFVFDASGNIYFTDGSGHRIRKLTPVGNAPPRL